MRIVVVAVAALCACTADTFPLTLDSGFESDTGFFEEDAAVEIDAAVDSGPDSSAGEDASDAADATFATDTSVELDGSPEPDAAASVDASKPLSDQCEPCLTHDDCSDGTCSTNNNGIPGVCFRNCNRMTDSFCLEANGLVCDAQNRCLVNVNIVPGGCDQWLLMEATWR